MILNVFSLAICWIFVILLGMTDWISEWDRYEFFPRVGAVLTVLAAIVEYNLSMGKVLKLREGTGVGMGAIMESLQFNNCETRIKAFAHLSFIVGSIVWAFGDLIY